MNTVIVLNPHHMTNSTVPDTYREKYISNAAVENILARAKVKSHTAQLHNPDSIPTKLTTSHTS